MTGANGWLGRRLARIVTGRMAASSRMGTMRALVLPGESADVLEGLGVEVLRGDIRNPADCARFCADGKDSVLLHIAGVIHPRRVREFYEINRNGTQNLLSAAVAARVRRAVVLSSNSPMGTNRNVGEVFDESSPFHPYMNYGRSKMEMELAVQRFAQSGDIETVVLRSPWFYGPDQPARQTLFFSMIRSGKAPIVGDGNNLRSMAYLDNLCGGLLLAASVEGARGQTYWIADRRPYSMNEIVDTVERLLEHEFKLEVAHKRVRLPNLVSELALLADGFLQGLGFYNQKIHVLSEMNKTIACSIAKAAAELGYHPEISLEEGMRRSIADCLNRGIRI